MAGETDVPSVGKPIDLGGEPTLNARLVELAHQEQALYNVGVACAIKDRADTACSACPVRCDDPNVALASLCHVGREQERVATQLAARRLGG